MAEYELAPVVSAWILLTVKIILPVCTRCVSCEAPFHIDLLDLTVRTSMQGMSFPVSLEAVGCQSGRCLRWDASLRRRELFASSLQSQAIQICLRRPRKRASLETREQEIAREFFELSHGLP